MIINQVRNPQCLDGFSEGGSVSLSLEGGGFSLEVGQAYFVRQSIRSMPSLNDRMCGSPNYTLSISFVREYVDGTIAGKFDYCGLLLIYVLLSV